MVSSFANMICKRRLRDETIRFTDAGASYAAYPSVDSGSAAALGKDAIALARSQLDSLLRDALRDEELVAEWWSSLVTQPVRDGANLARRDLDARMAHLGEDEDLPDDLRKQLDEMFGSGEGAAEEETEWPETLGSRMGEALDSEHPLVEQVLGRVLSGEQVHLAHGKGTRWAFSNLQHSAPTVDRTSALLLSVNGRTWRLPLELEGPVASMASTKSVAVESAMVSSLQGSDSELARLVEELLLLEYLSVVEA
eukprot:scaffold48_cov395-Prasinococcus_capsulatus_cf.AAC.18